MNTAYIESLLAGSESEQKSDCRMRVLSHIMSRHAAKQMVLLSMPGARWRFENEMQSFVSDAKFIGVERNVRVWNEARLWMPGSNTLVAREEHGRAYFDYAESSCARLACGDLSAMLRVKGRSHCGTVSKEQSRDFAHRWSRATAVWLDFNGQLCNESMDCLSMLGAFLHRHTETVPVAITFMGARESGNARNVLSLLENRTAVVRAYLNGCKWRTFELDDEFEYAGNSGTPMVTVMGRMILKSKATS